MSNGKTDHFCFVDSIDHVIQCRIEMPEMGAFSYWLGIDRVHHKELNFIISLLKVPSVNVDWGWKFTMENIFIAEIYNHKCMLTGKDAKFCNDLCHLCFSLVKHCILKEI